MGRARRSTHATAREIPRNVVTSERVCSHCRRPSAFDGAGGEWCANCQTAEHLVARERLYRLVEIELDDPASAA